jgi:hypothetical protein
VKESKGSKDFSKDPGDADARSLEAQIERAVAARQFARAAEVQTQLDALAAAREKEAQAAREASLVSERADRNRAKNYKTALQVDLDNLQWTEEDEQLLAMGEEDWVKAMQFDAVAGGADDEFDLEAEAALLGGAGGGVEEGKDGSSSSRRNDNDNNNDSSNNSKKKRGPGSLAVKKDSKAKALLLKQMHDAEGRDLLPRWRYALRHGEAAAAALPDAGVLKGAALLRAASLAVLFITLLGGASRKKELATREEELRETTDDLHIFRTKLAAWTARLLKTPVSSVVSLPKVDMDPDPVASARARADADADGEGAAAAASGGGAAGGAAAAAPAGGAGGAGGRGGGGGGGRGGARGRGGGGGAAGSAAS